MSKFFERPRIGKPAAVALIAVVVLAVVATAIVIAYRAGSDNSTSSEPDGAESTAAAGLPGADEVHDPLEVIDGTAYDGDLYIFRGYERSYVGAVSAAVNWLSAYGGSLDPDYSQQLGEALLVENDNQSPEDWRDWPTNRREDLGVATTGNLPDGYGLNAAPMAYQTRNATSERIEVILLVRLTGSSPYGSTSANTVLTMDLVWTGSDWADSGNDMGGNYSALKVDVDQETSERAKELGWLQLTW